METETQKQEVITLDKVNVRSLPELQGWKEKQEKIVVSHPFVKIEDNKTYEEAKKHRTALVSARTDIQKQDKLIASKLKELRSESKKVAEELIQITQPHEEKQQDEVKRYEDKKEAERREAERKEVERKETIQSQIKSVYAYWKTKISQLEFENISEFEKSLENGISKQDSEEMEEFEMDWAEKKNLLNNQLEERIKYITNQEEAKKERERLAEERRKFEEEKRQEEEARKAREEADRKKREAEEKERKAKEEKERKQREAEAERFRKQQEQIEAEKRKQAQKTFEIRCNRLNEIGFVKDNSVFLNHTYNIELDAIEDDVYVMDIEEFEDFIQDAKTKLTNAKAESERRAKEEAERKAKQEAEEKERKEAEAKRLKELQPDKEKIKGFIQSLQFTEESPELKDKAMQDFLTKIKSDVEVWKKASADEIEEIK